ncbi:MAG: acyl-CoA thioesterase, partial [Acidiferrobacteraceae bacterium]|nr:acyl-CoA thioesterase [Acidiferrobacteraceae bacterium]
MKFVRNSVDRNSSFQITNAGPSVMELFSEQAVYDACPVVVELPVVWGEMDSMQHVNNTVYIRWMETARFEYFEKVELRAAAAQSGRTGILKSVDCNFRLPLTWPDKVLVGGKVIELGKDYFVIQHVVFSCKHQKVAAHGRAVVVGFDY